ncbi:sensor histidine kinase [Dehalogenimonas sp. THU2]|uniref:sensor histidine kinase n=1 Tax=Dehalogenimonas sp. THU2 TaxID=3151121 RepID=UPI003218A1D7
MHVSAPVIQARRFGGRLKLYLNVYRVLALALAVSQLSAFDLAPPLSAVVIAGAAIGYTAFKFFTPASPRNATTGQLFLALDIIFAGWLVWMTGGINSPFLLYTLAPVLSASLFYSSYVAMSVAVVSNLNILLAQLVNPLFNLVPGLPELSYFLIYIVAVSLSASLPYLVNINLRQRMQGEFIIEERQRLSREIHDGTVQTLSALSWQGQIIDRELKRRGIEMPEVDKLLHLVEGARTEALESLELLRRYSGCGQMIGHLKTYLQRLKQDTGIDYSLDLPVEEPQLPPYVELQLFRICQEALNNIRKHADANNISLAMVRLDGHLSVTIEDDGHGFDVTKHNRGMLSAGHGLNVMKERAESAGGNFRVVSFVGRGTTIKMDIPIDRR